MRRLTAQLRRLRKEQRLTSRDVAKMLGISLATVSRIETIGLGLHRDALVGLLMLYKVPRVTKAGPLQMLEQVNQPSLVSRDDSAVATWSDLERTARRICDMPSLVMREGKVADLCLEERADVAVYRLYWDEIHRLAYGPEESAAFIERIAATLNVDRERREREEQVH